MLLLTYIAAFFTLLTVFIYYRYKRFKKLHICSTNDSIVKFFRFWLKRLPQNSDWKNFIKGEGTFRYNAGPISGPEEVYGGGISGTW